MRNKIEDLNNHLFAQLERLGDEDLKSEDLDKEISRAKAISDVAGKIIESAQVTVKAMEVLEKAGHGDKINLTGVFVHHKSLDG